MRVAVLLFVATLLSTSDAFFDPIRLPTQRSTAADGGAEISSCLSWRLTVETHNRQDGKLVPQACADYVRQYMVGGQYKADCEEMANVAIEYAKSKKAAADGKDIWVFDIDETTLFNLGYYQDPEVQFGSLKPADKDKFFKWVELGKSVAVPGIQRLYNTTLSLGFNNVLLTGVWTDYASIRQKNLKDVGYDNWKEIIFKYVDASTNKFKSDERTRLVKEGYRIVGNVGDQWGDITGENVGERTFKVPNPMYYK